MWLMVQWLKTLGWINSRSFRFFQTHWQVQLTFLPTSLFFYFNRTPFKTTGLHRVEIVGEGGKATWSKNDEKQKKWKLSHLLFDWQLLERAGRGGFFPPGKLAVAHAHTRAPTRDVNSDAARHNGDQTAQNRRHGIRRLILEQGEVWKERWEQLKEMITKGEGSEKRIERDKKGRRKEGRQEAKKG